MGKKFQIGNFLHFLKFTNSEERKSGFVLLMGNVPRRGGEKAAPLNKGEREGAVSGGTAWPPPPCGGAAFLRCCLSLLFLLGGGASPSLALFCGAAWAVPSFCGAGFLLLLWTVPAFPSHLVGAAEFSSSSMSVVLLSPFLWVVVMFSCCQKKKNEASNVMWSEVRKSKVVVLPLSLGRCSCLLPHPSSVCCCFLLLCGAAFLLFGW